MNNMKVGASSTNFAAVKTVFERNYNCMGITCAEVGGLWNSAASKYYDGASPCSGSVVNWAAPHPSASWARIAGYAPGSQVTSHNAIDLDQKALENMLGVTPIQYANVKSVYENGGNSKTYAEFSVNALSSAVGKGDAVVGATSGVTGKMYSSYSAGATSTKVAYATADAQSTYVGCKGGALQNPPTGTTATADAQSTYVGCKGG